jgi:hypothetical protein
VQNTFWRSYANVLGFTYGRLCAFVDEFFCKTVSESLDQWIEEYGLNDPCDPYGFNLCHKVAAYGGARCEDFVQTALDCGWVVTCHDLNKEPEPIAGCFEIGCTPLGPTPAYTPPGSNIGYGEIGACIYGEVVSHPDPQKWESGRHEGASCPVPGSNLGHGPDTDESCCFIVGFYDFPSRGVAVSSTYCQALSDAIEFDCPRSEVTADTNPCVSKRLHGLRDSTGNYSEWGNAFVWRVVVDMSASRAAQLLSAGEPVSDDTQSAAGCFMVGNILLPDGGIGGTPLCVNGDLPDPAFVLCFLERIKPAHTTLIVEVD